MKQQPIAWDSIRDRLLADPEVKAEYDALEDEFDLASRAIAIRASTGLNQREFAERVGMKQSQLARIESGKQIPKLETLAKLAAAAGYAVEVNFISLDEQQKPLTQSDFQNWLNRKISDDPEVILAGKLEYLRLYLTDAMRQLREKAGLNQAQLAEKLGVQQAAVSKLESALKDRKLESVLQYLHTLDAELLMAVKQGDEIYQVSDNEGVMLVDVPEEVELKAAAEGMTLREYVCAAIEQFSKKAISANETAIETFLKSDDEVAVRVRERLKDQSIEKIAKELEKCWKIPDEEDRRFEVKKILDPEFHAVGMTRNTVNNDNNDIEIDELTDDLLDRLAEILDKSA